MLFENISPSRFALVWAIAVAVAMGAVSGVVGVNRWSRAPGDFVVVCRDSVPAIPPPAAGLAPRLAALDSMVACTERMESQYIAKGDRAFRASLALIALAMGALSFGAVITRRFVASRKRRAGAIDGHPRT